MRADLGRPVLAIVLALAALLGGANAVADGGRITGRVIDTDTQAPVANADVELANVSGGQGYFRARTNGRGEFAIDRVPSDRWYMLTVSADRYADFVLGGWQFPAAQRSVELVIPLDRAGTLEVKLTKSDGRTPVAGARVSIVSERSSNWWESYRPPPAPVFSNASGVARFDGLTAGDYRVNADVSGLRPADAGHLTVRRGQTTPVPLKMTRPASVSGQVRLADGRGVAGLVVTARGPSEAVGSTDADGNFAIGDLAPGRYRLDVTHDGFQPLVTKDSYALSEGGSRDGVALTVTPKAPELSIVLEREAFLPDANVRIGLRTFRIDDVDVTVSRVPNDLLLDSKRDFRNFAFTADTLGLVPVSRWKHVVGAGPEWSWREGEVLVPDTLSPGAYVVRGRSGALERRAIFFVTDLGLLVKRSASQLLVSAGTLRASKPAPDVRVFTIVNPAPASIRRPAGQGQGWTGAIVEKRGMPPVRTDARGLVTIPTPGGVPAGYTGPRRVNPPLRVVAIGEGFGVAVVDPPLAPAVEQGGDRAFVYTDRSIYRPGHTVHWKTFARKASGTVYTMPDPKPALVTLSGPDGAAIPVPNATLSARGSSDGAIELPAGISLGDWTLSVYAGAASGRATFAVQEYRKPEFQVEVTPDREIYVNGDEVRFRIAATYFFGAPVFGAAVRYSLFESRLARDEDSFEWGETQTGGYGRVLKTGETRNDLDGRAEVVLTPERVSYDRRLTLEVEVLDASNRVVSGRGSAVMGRGLFALFVRPRAFVLAAGAPVPIEVQALDHAGKPVSTAVTVDLDQEAWNPLERRYTRSTRPLASATVTTDRTGRAQLSLAPSPARAGQILIHARAEDAKHNRITAQGSVWVWDERVTEYAYRYPALEAFADRDRYKPGDTLRVLINTDVKNGQVLACLEGNDLYDTRVLSLTGGTGVASFVLRPEYAPNAFVSVHVRKGREIHTRTLEVPIAAERHDLAITLTPDHDRYSPRDSARVRIETHDGGGRPVPAEVSVAVVDEALFALKPDNTPDAHDLFYGRRPNAVTTAVAFPVMLFGGADKGGREEVRRDFRDVALWAPTVLTDANGRADVVFRYPDNLTTWRVTSRGATDQTLVGKQVAKTLVTKDLVARLAGPRFLIAGDEAALVSVTTNRSDAPLVGVDASLAAQGPIALSGGTSTKFNVPARGEGRSTWRVRVPPEPPRDTSDAVLTFRARGKTDSDALEVRVPVRARATPVYRRGAGIVDGTSRTITAALPNDLVRFGSSAAIEIAPSPTAVAIAASADLLNYPYGCTEQTANAIRSTVSVLAALKGTGITLPRLANPDSALKRYVQRLASTQLPEGGWGWWSGGDFDPYLTVIAVDALARAAAFGVMPGDASSALSGARQRLPRAFAETRSTDGEAYMLGHLVSLLELPGGREQLGDLRERLETLATGLVASRAELGNAGLALATSGVAALGKKSDAKTLLDLLMSRAEKDGAGIHWSADPDAETSWFGEDVECTAYALSALMRVNPDDSRAAEIVRWLTGRRAGRSWRSTRVSGPAVIGLADYLAAHRADAKPNYRLRVEWNGETVLDRTVTPTDALGEPMRIAIPAAKMKPGDNRVTITKTGTGVAYYAWEAKAFVPSPGPAPPRDAPFTLAREYLRAERTSDRRGRPRYLASPIEANTPLHVGEQVMVRLTLTAPKAVNWVMIEDPRIAGFEIDALTPDGTEHPWNTHAEERDDRAAFFLDRLESGETVIEYLARPEIAGAFTALPTTAGAMYAPERHTRGDEARVRVAEK